MEHEWKLPIPMFESMSYIPETTRILLGTQLFLFCDKQWWMTQGIRSFFSEWFKRSHPQYRYVSVPQPWIYISPAFEQSLMDYSANADLADILIEFASAGIILVDMIEPIIDLYSFPILQHHFPVLEEIRPDEFEIIREDFLAMLPATLTAETLSTYDLPHLTPGRITFLHQEFIRLTPGRITFLHQEFIRLTV
jgi:hypothetical protein